MAINVQIVYMHYQEKGSKYSVWRFIWKSLKMFRVSWQSHIREDIKRVEVFSNNLTLQLLLDKRIHILMSMKILVRTGLKEARLKIIVKDKL